METFKTEDEAKKKADEVNACADPTDFCPLINTKCKKDCVCFQKAYVQPGQSQTWYVYGFNCTNGMFSGYRTCQPG